MTNEMQNELTKAIKLKRKIELSAFLCSLKDKNDECKDFFKDVNKGTDMVEKFYSNYLYLIELINDGDWVIDSDVENALSLFEPQHFERMENINRMVSVVNEFITKYNMEKSKTN